MRKFILTILVIILALIVSGCGTFAASNDNTGQSHSTPLPTDARLLTIGDISDEPDQVIAFWQPLANYLAASLADEGIDGGAVKVAPDLETMTRWLETGIVDIYMDSAYPSLVVSRESGSIPILSHDRNGVSEYHAVIFTLNSSGLSDLDDLQGQLVAFDAPYSTSGYFLPAYFLLSNGFNLTEKSSNSSPVGANEIGYVFSYQDINALQWLLSQRVNAVVTDSTAFEKIPASTRDQITVIAETESMPRRLVSVRVDLDQNILNALIETLEAMSDSEAGLTVLDAIKASGFDQIPGGLENFMSRTDSMLAVVEG